MSTTTDATIADLVRIAESVALEQCEAVECRQEPCPLQSDDQEQWCLPCLAHKALSEHLKA